MGRSREIAEQQPNGRADNPQIQCSFTTPQDWRGEIIQALLSEDRYEFAKSYDDSQLVIAATMIAADLLWTAKWGPPAVRRNLDSSAATIPDRGMGFCEPQLMACVPLYASVSIKKWRRV